MKKIVYSLIMVLFFQAQSWAQTCAVKQMVQEEFNEEGESIEKKTYTLYYNQENVLEEVQIQTEEEDLNTLKFEKIGSDTKITWFLDGEYDRHFLVTNASILVFDGQDQNSFDVDYADEYLLTFENNLLTKIDDNRVFYWELGNVIKSESIGKKGKSVTTYSYINAPNPFLSLHKLGAIDVLANSDFIPYIYTLSSQVINSEESVRIRNGEMTSNPGKDHKYSHKVNQDGCVIEFTEHAPYHKLMYTFKY
ncbi:hypothetical protein [Costertonia aggregata]|uniref:GLPGLI family protein n=1 Tax=Costertonia aggregata TaxID=343403 RepID=A0A7H9ALJ4_9FLAO|nr:hypothetical protein [Costertonia aggregata]QLG44330.1 hypothetical protein HYG79_02875 [Costertonia aggregata]